MLTLDSVTVQIGGVRPLDDVSATFDPGVNGLIGPNGAGKTTTLNVLSGFMRPTRGAVVIDDTDLARLRPSQRARWGVRRMFQQEHVVRELSLRDNVLVVAEHVGASPDEVDAALEWVGLDDTGRSAQHLSQVDARRLEFARVSVGHPRLVLLDEPGAGLAEADAETLIPLIADLGRRDGTIVLLIDHDMEMVTAVCDTITVLDFGRVLASGPAGETLADPAVRRAYLGDEDVA